MTPKLITGYLVLGLIVRVDARQVSQTPPDVMAVPAYSEIWLEGTIGKDASVRLYIETAAHPKSAGPQPDGLWGMYYYTKYWAAIPIDGACVTVGDCLSTGRLHLEEGDPYRNAALKPRLDLEVQSSGQVTGSWTSADGTRKLPVRLRKIPQPEPYDVAIQHPTRFADPRWLITFEYPQEWFLGVTETTLLLRSRDPMYLLFDKELRCTRGSRLPRAPKDDSLWHLNGDFYLSRDGWVVKSSLSDQRERPNIRKEGTAVIMSAESGYRGSTPWGYGGITSSNEYLFIDGAEWVQCTDRLFLFDRIGVRTPAR